MNKNLKFIILVGLATAAFSFISHAHSALAEDLGHYYRSEGAINPGEVDEVKCRGFVLRPPIGVTGILPEQSQCHPVQVFPRRFLFWGNYCGVNTDSKAILARDVCLQAVKVEDPRFCRDNPSECISSPPQSEAICSLSFDSELESYIFRGNNLPPGKFVVERFETPGDKQVVVFPTILSSSGFLSYIFNPTDGISQTKISVSPDVSTDQPVPEAICIATYNFEAPVEEAPEAAEPVTAPSVRTQTAPGATRPVIVFPSILEIVINGRTKEETSFKKEFVAGEEISISSLLYGAKDKIRDLRKDRCVPTDTDLIYKLDGIAIQPERNGGPATEKACQTFILTMPSEVGTHKLSVIFAPVNGAEDYLKANKDTVEFRIVSSEEEITQPEPQKPLQGTFKKAADLMRDLYQGAQDIVPALPDLPAETPTEKAEEEVQPEQTKETPEQEETQAPKGGTQQVSEEAPSQIERTVAVFINGNEVSASPIITVQNPATVLIRVSDKDGLKQLLLNFNKRGAQEEQGQPQSVPETCTYQETPQNCPPQNGSRTCKGILQNGVCVYDQSGEVAPDCKEFCISGTEYKCDDLNYYDEKVDQCWHKYPAGSYPDCDYQFEPVKDGPC